MNMAATTGERPDPEALPDLTAFPGTADTAPTLLIRARLLQARRVARDGAPDRARRLCAGPVLEAQFWICRDADLLQLALATLFEARGFQLLRRLLAAARGRHARFIPIPPDALPPIPQGIAATSLADGTLVFRFAETLFDDPAHETLIDSWSREMAAPA